MVRDDFKFLVRVHSSATQIDCHVITICRLESASFGAAEHYYGTLKLYNGSLGLVGVPSTTPFISGPTQRSSWIRANYVKPFVSYTILHPQGCTGVHIIACERMVLSLINSKSTKFHLQVSGQPL